MMKTKTIWAAAVWSLFCIASNAQSPSPSAQPDALHDAPRPAPARVSALRITVLSTMLADAGIGEWGFAALVEVDGHRILFDTGARPNTVLDNARELGIDLSQVREVILSHNHSDHVGGLMTLRRELRRRIPRPSPVFTWREESFGAVPLGMAAGKITP